MNGRFGRDFKLVMWTPATRGRMAEIEKKTKRYPTDLTDAGGGWRMLPKDFPPWPTVYWWFRRFVRRFLFQTIHDVALMLDRERVGREASPTGGVIDSQSVKAPEAKTRGYDAAKKIVGRKRHIAVDTDGRLLKASFQPRKFAAVRAAHRGVETSIRGRPRAAKYLTLL